MLEKKNKGGKKTLSHNIYKKKNYLIFFGAKSMQFGKYAVENCY